MVNLYVTYLIHARFSMFHYLIVISCLFLIPEKFKYQFIYLLLKWIDELQFPKLSGAMLPILQIPIEEFHYLAFSFLIWTNLRSFHMLIWEVTISLFEKLHVSLVICCSLLSSFPFVPFLFLSYSQRVPSLFFFFFSHHKLYHHH